MDISYIEKNAGPIANAVIRGFQSKFGPKENKFFDGQIASNGEGASPSLIRAISNSKNSSKVLSRNKGITEPIYAGGNTAANIRGVMRSENKILNEDIKERYGRTAQGFISRSKQTY